jgi:UDP-2,3-diacylglucosamine hydrolase
MSRYYFISDVHLGYGPRHEDRVREARLVSVLDRILAEAVRGEVAGVFLVGDVFDSWFEFSSVIPRRHVRTLGVLARIADLVPVEYLMGNHDFGHRDFFLKELSIPVHHGDIERTLGGKRFYISHGDGKAVNDTGYIILRKILRSKLMRAIYWVIHPDLGIPFAEYLSGRSRAYTDQRDALRKGDGLRTFAENLLAKGTHDVIVMGHQHTPQIAHTEHGIYVNLGDWIFNYTFGIFDAEGFRLETAPLLEKPSSRS